MAGDCKVAGRNKAYCDAYRAGARHEKSHARRIVRHLQRFPGDEIARMAFNALPAVAKDKLIAPPRPIAAKKLPIWT